MDERAEAFHLLDHKLVLEMRLVGDVIDELVVPALGAEMVGEELVGLLEGAVHSGVNGSSPKNFLGG